MGDDRNTETLLTGTMTHPCATGANDRRSRSNMATGCVRFSSFRFRPPIKNQNESRTPCVTFSHEHHKTQEASSQRRKQTSWSRSQSNQRMMTYLRYFQQALPQVLRVQGNGKLYSVLVVAIELHLYCPMRVSCISLLGSEQFLLL